jgi:hypothetical protein
MKKILLVALLSLCFTGIVFSGGKEEISASQTSEHESNPITENIQPPEWLWGTWHTQINGSTQTLLIGDREFSVNGTSIYQDTGILSVEDAADDTRYLVYIKQTDGYAYNQEFYKPSGTNAEEPVEIQSVINTDNGETTTVMYTKE